jgi:hypothetical protein
MKACGIAAVPKDLFEQLCSAFIGDLIVTMTVDH